MDTYASSGFVLSRPHFRSGSVKGQRTASLIDKVRTIRVTTQTPDSTTLFQFCSLTITTIRESDQIKYPSTHMAWPKSLMPATCSPFQLQSVTASPTPPASVSGGSPPKVAPKVVLAPATQACGACGKPVYIVEQLEVNGRKYHKRCVRCHVLLRQLLWLSALLA